MKKISIALATYNEKDNISRCLRSVQDWADEIVIVDGTSNDGTPDIAESYGARIITKPNNKNFHINKQIAIDECRAQWILQLDADEVVSAGLRREIDGLIASNSEQNGYWIPRKNWFLGRFLTKGGQYPDYTLRLYRNGKGKLPQKDVHEQAIVEGEIGFLKEDLLHYPYKDFRAYLKKWQRYNIFAADILAKELKNKPAIEHIKIFLLELLFKPLWWFVWTYGRHKGFVDGWQGFVFSLFSSLRFPVSYIEYLRFKV